MLTNDITYVACGFQEDCNNLFDLFKKNESIRFESFCQAWKEMKFSLIFLCRKTYAEMLEFCEETLNIAKQFVLSSTELIDRVGGLYLLYGLYYKIPIENIKIRVTAKEWQTFLNLHDQIKDEKLYDASYIFVKLLTDHAFHHCLFDTETGLEKSYKTRLDNTPENPYSVLPNIIDEVENGELGNIQKLSHLYNEQKAKLLNTTTKTNKLELFNKNFIDDIVNDVVSLQGKRQELTGLRKRTKELTLLNKTEKPKYNYEDKIRPKLGHGFDTDSSDDENMDIQFAFVNTDNHSLEDTELALDEIEDDDVHKNNVNEYSVQECNTEESCNNEMQQ